MRATERFNRFDRFNRYNAYFIRHVLLMSIAVLLILCLSEAETAPMGSNKISRVKRVSDQRLAELETLVALNRKLNGKPASIPLGFGKLDPKLLGRKRRSEVNSNQLQESLNELFALPMPQEYEELELVYLPEDPRYYDKH